MRATVRMCRLFVLIGLLLPLPLASCCSLDEDCSLNGVCSGGKCVCDAAWTGTDCGTLNLLPTPKTSGYQNPKASSWGGSLHPARRDANSSTWFMFASEFVNGCGLNDWSPNSRVVRTRSDTGPLGPYIFDHEILPTFHHNPQVVSVPTSYLLFVIGRNCANTIDCSSGPQPPPPVSPCYQPDDPTIDNMESGISAFTADDLLDNVWTRVGTDPVLGNDLPASTWDNDSTNPSAVVLKNGSVLMMYRGCGQNCGGGERIGLAVAQSFLSTTYTRLTSAPLCDRPDGSCDSEDPHVYMDVRGNFHALLHSLAANGGFECFFNSSSGLWQGCDVGMHAFSRDGANWTFSRTVAYNTTVQWTDGTMSVLARRERPQLVLINGAPAFLSNGASFAAPPPAAARRRGGTVGGGVDDRSFTLVVPIQRNT